MSIIPSTTYPGVYSPSTTLKRTRSIEGLRKFDASRIPPLPLIKNELVLQVFTHKSLRRPHVPPADYGDNERLADLGKVAFEVAMTYALFRMRPLLQVADISKHRRTLLSSTMVDDWVTFYKLRPKLRCHRDVASSLKSQQETNSLFHAYVGGLYVISGPQVVNDWINGLLEQELETIFGVPESDVDDHPMVEVPPQKRAKSEATFPGPQIEQPPIFFASQPPPSPPVVRQAPMYLPIPPANPPNPLAPAQPNLPFLPLFNQAAMQRRVTVEYLAEFSGPSHSGRWIVKCIVNGICKGEGTGNTKQNAKEEAARKAYYSMGWT